MIITTQRHPFNRWIDRLLTLAGWFAFSYLLAQGLLLLLRHSMNTAGFEKIDPIFPTLSTFLFYGLVLGINALLLLGWSHWHQRELQKSVSQRGLYHQPLSHRQEQLSTPLHFADEHIDMVRHNQVVVLYHSQDGAVEHVKTSTTVAPSPLAEVIPLPARTPANRPTPHTLIPVQSV